eukprot:1145032-Pelagomonas_calceolata.AAC.6
MHEKGFSASRARHFILNAWEGLLCLKGQALDPQCMRRASVPQGPGTSYSMHGKGFSASRARHITAWKACAANNRSMLQRKRELSLKPSLSPHGP